jgi:hypothetical protein
MLHITVGVQVEMPDGTKVISIGELDTVVQVAGAEDMSEIELVAARTRSMLANLEQRISARCDEFVQYGQRSA